MNQCIAPADIKEGDLLACVEGEAEAQVQDHIRRCPACAYKVAQLRQTSQALLALRSRAACPPPEVLGQYCLDLLPAREKLKLAAHIRSCADCARELAELAEQAEPEDNLVQWARQALHNVAQVLEAKPVSRLQPAPARGSKDEPRQRVYHAPGLDLVIGLVENAPSSGMTLMGVVQQVDQVTGGHAWLFREGEQPISSVVDAQGIFTFEGLGSGIYDIALAAGQQVILIREMVIHGH
jgi:hypothetical protein